MPFDGMAAKSISDSLQLLLSDGRVEKALQPEKDEIIFIIRARGANHRLLLSASPNCARIQITKQQKENPDTPPVFCMLLRKHLVGGKIRSFQNIDYDRIIEIEFLTTNDFGESCRKYIVIEIMGRHSNIILLNEQRTIIDSIKHIDFEISSVREVMPGRPYLLPPQQNKVSPRDLLLSQEARTALFHPPISETEEIKELRIDKYIVNAIQGFSPIAARELCELADIPATLRCSEVLFGESRNTNIHKLQHALTLFLESAQQSEFQTPYIFYRDPEMRQPFDFYFMDMRQYAFKQSFPSFSEAMDAYYAGKDGTERAQQRKADLVKVIANNIDRCLRKIGIQEAAIRDAAKGETYQLYGELITANLYQIESRISSVTLPNYYSQSMEPVAIPLDPHKSANQNAQNYFKKYNKAKSTLHNATIQLAESKEELTYLQSVMQSLEQAEDSAEIAAIREELIAGSYMKRKKSKKKVKNIGKELKPKQFYSQDGFPILVGRNNTQNDILTLRTAGNNDLWFHTKNIPGSHVILRTMGETVSPESIQEAAELAAYYSKASESQNVPVDYTQVRNVRKPQGAKPGMVIYENQKTIYVEPRKPKTNPNGME